MRVCTSCRRLVRDDAARCPDDGAAAEFVATLPIGTRLGVYQIDRVLGDGGMGFVYEATHTTLNRRTAIKMLRPELATNEQIVTRFLNEAKAVNLIQHQNIVNVYDYGDNRDGGVYFIMEYLEGETLDALMRRWRPMPLPLLLHVFSQVCKALVAAHAKSIVHRDLKPANIFVVHREGNPFFIKLLDFGIAQLRGAGAVQGLTLAGSVMGTPQYMSPEQVTGETVDARADVWAMGVMLYRAATGEAPFKGEEFAELADKILHHPPRPAGEVAPMPASLSALIMSCLERRPDARCPSIAEVMAQLERVKHECQLADEAVMSAALAAFLGGGSAASTSLEPRTDQRIAGSLPENQIGAEVMPPIVRMPTPAARAPSVLALWLLVGVSVAVLGGTAYWKFGRPSHAVTPPDQPMPDAVVGPSQLEAKEPTIKELYDAGKAEQGRALAEKTLREAIRSGTRREKDAAIGALQDTRVVNGAPLLYEALKGDLDTKIKAAKALAKLGLPDSAPKIRAALGGAGAADLDLAIALFQLGDDAARAIVVAALKDPASRLKAAAALAEAGDASVKPVLLEELAAFPAGSRGWLRAAAALLKLGDAGARALLQKERAQSPERAIPAAMLLAQAGDAAAKDQLVRKMKDVDFSARGEAALGLARLGDEGAMDWVDVGFASDDETERMRALQICAALPARASLHLATIVKLATDDVDLSVRYTAQAVLLGM